MSGGGARNAGLLQRLLRQPDEVMLEAGAGGELVVARMRAWANGLLLLLPLSNHLSGGSVQESLIGLAGTICTMLMSLVLLALARQQGRYRWLPYLSCSYDITIVTISLLLLGLHEPSGGVNSMVIWSFYLTSIFLTALRNDGRLAVGMGTLAFVQFLCLGGWILQHFPPAALASPGYGIANWGTVVQRLVLIVICTIVTAAIILRMQRLVDLAGTDSLTGVANRSWLGYRFPKLAARARRRGKGFCLAIIDLDHFKRINDDLGHLGGDQALCHFIRIAREQLRADDWIVRLGGEEFGVVMQDSMDDATQRLEQLRERVADSVFEAGDGRQPCKLTFSAGIACFPVGGSTLPELLSNADRRLAVAKRTGRNRVVTDDLLVQGLPQSGSRSLR